MWSALDSVVGEIAMSCLHETWTDDLRVLSFYRIAEPLEEWSHKMFLGWRVVTESPSLDGEKAKVSSRVVACGACAFDMSMASSDTKKSLGSNDSKPLLVAVTSKGVGSSEKGLEFGGAFDGAMSSHLGIVE